MPAGLPLLDRVVSSTWAVWSPQCSGPEPMEPIRRRDKLGKQGSGCLSCAWDPHADSRSQGKCRDSHVPERLQARQWTRMTPQLRDESEELFTALVQARPHVGGDTRSAAVDRMVLGSHATGGQGAVKLQHAHAACRTAVDTEENIHGRKTKLRRLCEPLGRAVGTWFSWHEHPD